MPRSSASKTAPYTKTKRLTHAEIAAMGKKAPVLLESRRK